MTTQIPLSPAAHAKDDTVLPFQVEGLDVRGRVVRLGDAIDRIITRHKYPEPVSRLLGEATALTVLLGTTLKEQGRFQLQTRSDGPVYMLIVDFEAPDKIRACARFDADALHTLLETSPKPATGVLLGKGHLAMTVDPGGEMKQYQGVVPLSNGSLEDAAHLYFQQSEQIPTRVRLAVGQAWGAKGEAGARHSWWAGGLMVQYLPLSERTQRERNEGHSDPEPHMERENDAWAEARSFVETVEDHELIDPTLSSEQLLYRLFHERGVRVFKGQPVHEQCHCSESRVRNMLLSFSVDDKRHMADEAGSIGVTCDFCSTHYSFTLEDILNDQEDKLEDKT